MTAPKPLFSAEQIIEDGKNRIARTVGQVTMPGALVTVIDYALQRWAGQEALPPSVVGALIVILTGLAAWATNLKRLRGDA